MKKILFTSLVMISVSCSKDKGINCTTCRESQTGIEREFCGTPSQVKTFKEELIRLGNNIGQRWSCR